MPMHTFISLVCTSFIACAAPPGQPEKSAPTGPVDAESKLTLSKDALGRVIDERKIRGELSPSDAWLDDGSWFDLHTATLSRGQRVQIDLRSGDFDPYLLIFHNSPQGPVLIGENDDFGNQSDARVTFTVAIGGEYAILANSASKGETGSYSLGVSTRGEGSAAPSARTDARAATGQAYRGRLTPGEDHRLDDNSLYEAVSFEGRRGDRLELRLASDHFDPVLALFHSTDSGLELLTSDDDSGEGLSSLIRVRLPYTGRYVAIVNAVSDQDWGDYELGIHTIAPATGSPAGVDWSGRYPGGGDPSSRYAVLVGIDDYPGVRSDLASCVVDTREMRRVLVDLLGFRDENIVIINDAEATREHILTAVREHLGQAGPDGAALLYYSGHGLQIGANLGDQDDEPDGSDEALYVWGPADQSSVILDEEIGQLMASMNAGARMVILDSCHSGTGTLGPSYKWVDPKDPWVADALVLPEEFLTAAERAGTNQDLLDGPADHILFAACSSSQVASAGQGGRPSVFTYFLVLELERAGPDVRWSDLESRVRASVDAYRRNNAEVVQVPQLEGPHADSTLIDFLGLPD